MIAVMSLAIVASILLAVQTLAALPLSDSYQGIVSRCCSDLGRRNAPDPALQPASASGPQHQPGNQQDAAGAHHHEDPVGVGSPGHGPSLLQAHRLMQLRRLFLESSYAALLRG